MLFFKDRTQKPEAKREYFQDTYLTKTCIQNIKNFYNSLLRNDQPSKVMGKVFDVHFCQRYINSKIGL